MTTTTKKLGDLLKLLTLLGEQTGHEDISLNQLKAFVYIALRDAQNDPAESREVADKMNLSSSGVSRTIASLGEYGRGSRSGLDLVQAKPDLADRRRKPVMLTRKGRKVIDEIIKEMT